MMRAIGMTAAGGALGVPYGMRLTACMIVTNPGKVQAMEYGRREPRRARL
jgi:hypothetical protein